MIVAENHQGLVQGLSSSLIEEGCLYIDFEWQRMSDEENEEGISNKHLQETRTMQLKKGAFFINFKPLRSRNGTGGSRNDDKKPFSKFE